MENYGKREGKKEKMESKRDGEIEKTRERKKYGESESEGKRNRSLKSL